MSDRPVETLVVGGGVVGLALAWELLRRGRSVRVLERDRPGRGASFAAAGMLAPISEAELEPAELIDFGRDSLRRYPRFVRDLELESGMSCGYRTEGTLWVAVRRDHLADLEHLEEAMTRKGLAANRISAERLLELEPHLSGRVLGGLEVPSDHQVDPRRLVRCLETAVRRLGGGIDTGCRVERIARVERALQVEGRSADGTPWSHRGDEVVIASGAWSGELAEGTSVRPVKGQLVRLSGPPLLRRVIRTPDVYLVPREGGELLVGGTMEEMGYDDQATGGAVMDLLRWGWELLPGIYDLALDEVSVGLRSAVDDHLPVIGGSATPGLAYAFGHFRNGILLAPATAHYLAEALVEGSSPAELRPFAPDRPVGVS